MNQIDTLLSTLNGGTLLISADHSSPVNAYITRVQAESVLSEALPGTAFSILTPTKCYEFAYYVPDLEIINRISEMPINPDPFHPTLLRSFAGRTTWPTRPLKNITGITIHHTLSHSPLNTSKYITATKGYPTTQYHYWVSQDTDSPISQLLPEETACWHDHTGTLQTTLSIGMAGHLGHTRPPEDQLWSTVRLVDFLLRKHSLTVDDVTGHHERAKAAGVNTECPGWLADTPNTIGSGVWKRDLCIALQLCLSGGEWGGY